MCLMFSLSIKLRVEFYEKTKINSQCFAQILLYIYRFVLLFNRAICNIFAFCVLFFLLGPLKKNIFPLKRTFLNRHTWTQNLVQKWKKLNVHQFAVNIYLARNMNRTYRSHFCFVPIFLFSLDVVVVNVFLHNFVYFFNSLLKTLFTFSFLSFTTEICKLKCFL